MDFPRHLLDIESLEAGQIELLLGLAARFKRERAAAREARAAGAAAPDRRGLLAGRTVVSLFFEASTRTRSSFETAARALGADVLSFDQPGSSLSKGETLSDTVRNLEAVGADAFVVRHPMAGAPLQLSRAVGAAVINAGDGAHEHPTQALLDALTLRERFGSLRGRTVAIVGDLQHSRVAHSNIHCLKKLGAAVRVAGPSTLVPIGIEKLGCTVFRALEPALEGADAVMALRLSPDRVVEARVPSTRDYARRWAITAAHVARLPQHAVVLHPGPVARGVEIAGDVVDGPRSLVLDQVDSGVAVRMAALVLCLRAPLPEEGAR